MHAHTHTHSHVLFSEMYSPLLPSSLSRCVTGETHNLGSLHTILSTGSPLKPQSYDYVYRCIKSNVLLGSISGEPKVVDTQRLQLERGKKKKKEEISAALLTPDRARILILCSV